MSTESVMPSNHLIPCHPFLLLLSIFPSIRVFSTTQSTNYCTITASRSFPKSQLFASGDQSIEASASVLPMNIQDWFPLGLNGLITLLFKGLSRVFTSTTVWKYQFFSSQPYLWANSDIYTCLMGKSHSFVFWMLSFKPVFSLWLYRPFWKNDVSAF